MDYIRLATLELVATEINSKNIPGAVAELGVYKGKFARYINQYFPSRQLYLFDTFEGFDKTDVGTELQNSFSSGEQDFSNTSVKEVLQRMPLPGQCIIKKGYFPGSAAGLEHLCGYRALHPLQRQRRCFRLQGTRRVSRADYH